MPPEHVAVSDLNELVRLGNRVAADDKQLAFLSAEKRKDVPIYTSGALEILKGKIVAIVGSRAASYDGQRRAARLAKELTAAGVVVSSGLAKGIDTAALTSAIEYGGKVLAVIGTPLDVAYPAENKRLQETIYANHLLLTPFKVGQRVYPSNFPQRNRVMALLSDATVIVEASDTSGTLHQAAECVRQNRLLFIAKSVVDDNSLTWPKQFVGKACVRVLEKTEDILSAI